MRCRVGACARMHIATRCSHVCHFSGASARLSAHSMFRHVAVRLMHCMRPWSHPVHRDRGRVAHTRRCPRPRPSCSTWLPSYLKDQLHFNLQSAGFITVMPYLCCFACSNLVGLALDARIQAGMRVPTARKWSQVIAEGLPALALVGVGFVSSTPLAVCFICVAVGAAGAAASGSLLVVCRLRVLQPANSLVPSQATARARWTLHLSWRGC